MPLVRRLGEDVGVRTRPHGLRHTAVTEVTKAATRNDMGIDEVLHFSRHRSLTTLMVYRDAEGSRQGELARLVSEGAEG